MTRKATENAKKLLTGVAAATILPLVLSSHLAQAAESQDDSFWIPYVGVTGGYDSNLLRRSSLAPIPESFGGDESTTFGTVFAGLRAEETYGRQRFTFDGELARRTYQDLDTLNHTGGSVDVAWHIKAGLNWTGQVTYNYLRNLRNFEFLEALTDDPRRSGRVGFKLIRTLGTRSQLELSGHHTDIRLDTPIPGAEDRLIDRDNLGLRYTYALGRQAKVGALVEHEVRDGVSNSDLGDFDHTSAGVFLQWSLTNKTHLEAEVHYAERDLDIPNGNDFDGVLGKLNFQWETTGKSTVQARYDRRLSNLADEIPGIALIDEIRIQPTWSPTDKIELGAYVHFERRNFRSEQDREDRLFTTGGTFTWSLPRSIELSLLAEHRNREGNSPLSDYNGTIVSLTLQADLR